MNDVNIAVESVSREKWYSYHRFPLIPQFEYRPENKHNRSSFYFNWLNFSFWTNMSIHLNLGVELDDMGLSLRIDPPYSHIRIQLLWFPYSWHQKLWRTKKYTYEE